MLEVLNHNSWSYALEADDLSAHLIDYHTNLSERARKIHLQVHRDRLNGNLKHGVSNAVEVSGRTGKYEGEVNANGEAHGFGVFRNKDNSVTGQFYKN